MATNRPLETRNGNAKHSNHTNGMNGHGQDSSESDDGMKTTHTNGTRPTRPAHSRKMSSPLAPAFMVSSPGKTIVFGEHAVVHGRVGLRS